VKKVCEDLHSDGSEKYDVYYTSLWFIDAIKKELGSSILGSPPYKFSLDLKFINDMQSVDHTKVCTNLLLYSVDMNIKYDFSPTFGVLTIFKIKENWVYINHCWSFSHGIFSGTCIC